MDQLVLAFTGDLSRGGMRLNSPKPLPVESEVDVTLALPDGGPEVIVHCQVMSVSEREAEGYALGVRFMEPDGAFLRRIEWFILNADPAAEQFGSHPHRRRLRIVIADDDPLQRKATSRPFIERGDDVRLAADGLEALGLCLKDRPEIVLTDVQMPKMDGWQLLRMLRGRPNLKTVPVLFHTTLSSEADRLVGYRLGVDDYLQKPCPDENLLAQVDRAAVRSVQQAQKAEPELERDSLRGDLSMVSLSSLLSFLELERRTGIIRVGPVTNGSLHLREGALVHIDMDGMSRDAPIERRFAALLGAREGRFEFRGCDVERGSGVQRSLSGLLLECARQSDEGAL
jgi:CheY-like chemotaxis protein